MNKLRKNNFQLIIFGKHISIEQQVLGKIRLRRRLIIYANYVLQICVLVCPAFLKSTIDFKNTQIYAWLLGIHVKFIH